MPLPEWVVLDGLEYAPNETENPSVYDYGDLIDDGNGNLMADMDDKTKHPRPPKVRQPGSPPYTNPPDPPAPTRPPSAPARTTPPNPPRVRWLVP